MSDWKDTTSYQRGERGAIEPDEWTLRGRAVSICVHRHIRYPPSVWLAECRNLGIERHELLATNIDVAKEEALILVSERVDEIAADLRRLRGEP